MTPEEFVQRVFEARHETRKTGRPWENAVVYLNPEDFATMMTHPHPAITLYCFNEEGRSQRVIDLPFAAGRGVDLGEIVLRWEVKA